MADASESLLNIDAPVVKQGRGRPRGSKNKTTVAAMGASTSSLVKRRPGHPAGIKNKPKVPSAIPGPSAPSPGTSSSSPRIYSFFCICNTAARFNTCHRNFRISWMGGNCVKQFSANTLVEELHMKWRCGTMAPVNSSSRALAAICGGP
jgi:hypothetical protein